MKLRRVATRDAGPARDRRAFLRAAAGSAGALAVLGGTQQLRMVRAAGAQASTAPPETVVRRSVCTHCSVGCGVIAEVTEGIWTGQEPDFHSPINLGAHCAKGASVREHGHGERRLKYPLKLVDGAWQRIDWDQAIEEIGARLLAIREESGPDSVFWCGSSKASNEGAYLQRKFAALWGTNNIDHQARICHSTTVAGVANTWGYGAMTSSFNDMHNARAILFIGSNPAEAHPIAMQHVLRGKENGARIIVVDPRFTRTAAHADQFVRLRPGTDVAFVWGLLWHVFENGWEDREYIEQRVWGMDAVREEVARWTPQRVADVTGVAEGDMRAVAQTMAENRPGSLVWCMGGTQSHIGSSNTRAYCIFQLALGNIGKAGGGADIFRGHDNVQGATDVGPNCHTLPGYYGLSEEAWRHWARVWDLDYAWLAGRFDRDRKYAQDDGTPDWAMHLKGIPVSRWVDGVLLDRADIQQRDNIRALFFMGHAMNSLTRGEDVKRALEAVDMLVIADPYPTHAAVLAERGNGIYLLPAATQFETRGSVTASNRSLQWREQVIEPLFESLPDHVILYRLARRLGFAGELFKHIAVDDGEPSIEDLLREINRGCWSIGYTGQSPERLKAHAANRHTFDTTTLRAEGGPCDGDYYGLPWPCWGTPGQRHPGTPILYDTSKPVAEGGLTFRARFGTEHDGESLLADGAYSRGSDIEDGYPEFSAELLEDLGWWHELTAVEQLAAAGRNWKTDLSGGIQRVAIAHGCAPFGNAKARCVVWNFPDPVPLHREPLHTPRRDLLAEHATYADRPHLYRLPTRYHSVQAVPAVNEFPLIFISGRLVEYEGGGAETRSNLWLAEMQQEMFVEIHPADANDLGVTDGAWVHMSAPGGGPIKVRAMVTRRVGRGVVFTPFHFGGWYKGEDLFSRYPEGAAPYVRGEACNTISPYGYDIVTQMQESKATLCRIEPA
ncbi:MAG: formate dehydrogenase subunit alpha [Gammaproteobacteria bacterium]